MVPRNVGPLGVAATISYPGVRDREIMPGAKTPVKAAPGPGAPPVAGFHRTEPGKALKKIENIEIPGSSSAPNVNKRQQMSTNGRKRPCRPVCRNWRDFLSHARPWRPSPVAGNNCFRRI